jgi:hypothetical protein
MGFMGSPGGAVVAKGEDIVAGGCPAHTIYIWPSRELIARSWGWPEAWHEAFEQAAGQLAGLVATCVLGGLPLTQEPATRRLRAGCVTFRVRCSGTRIYIAVLDFEGPHAPGPDGGTRRQPHPVDGLVLGLRGYGKAFTIVTFYGPLPPVPAENITRGPWRSVMLANLRANGNHSFDSRQSPIANVIWMPIQFRAVLPSGMQQDRCFHRNLPSVSNLSGTPETNERHTSFSLKEHRSVWRKRRDRSPIRKPQSFAGLGHDATELRWLRAHAPIIDCRFDRGSPSSDGAGMRLH